MLDDLHRKQTRAKRKADAALAELRTKLEQHEHDRRTALSPQELQAIRALHGLIDHFVSLSLRDLHEVRAALPRGPPAGGARCVTTATPCRRRRPQHANYFIEEYKNLRSRMSHNGRHVAALGARRGGRRRAPLTHAPPRPAPPQPPRHQVPVHYLTGAAAG